MTRPDLTGENSVRKCEQWEGLYLPAEIAPLQADEMVLGLDQYLFLPGTVEVVYCEGNHSLNNRDTSPVYTLPELGQSGLINPGVLNS